MTDNAETSPTPAPEAHNTIYVIGTRAAALLSLAALAPGLSEAELRTALYLASIEDPIHHTATASSRQIMKATRLSRSNIQRALDTLARRYLITTRQGTATRSASYLLSFTKTVTFQGGLTAGPPPAQMLLGGPTAGPPLGATIPPDFEGVALQQGHPSQPLTPVDKDVPPNIELIDRLLSAKKGDFDKPTLAELRRWVHGYQAQFGPDRNCHPPDDRLLAQLLTLAPLQQLTHLMQTLFQERKKPGQTYAWYVSVALQRIHGIQPETLKARRADLRAVRRPQPPEPTQDNLGFAENLISNLAKAKGM